MGKTITIPSSKDHDADDCVNDTKNLTIQFDSAGDFQTSGDTGDFDPPLVGFYVPGPLPYKYKALKKGAKVIWKFVVGGVLKDNGTIRIKHNDQDCEDP